MDSILRFASGLSSSVENFARDVYIKSNLTIELDRVVKQLMAENPLRADNNEHHHQSNRILIETPTVSLLCDILEAIFLHGLKEKLSTRVTAVFGGGGGGSQRGHPNKNAFSLDYWPIIKILSHDSETRHLKQLSNISTEIGCCRAWLRTALNESIFRSYFDTLICDSSLLNGYYRSTAYIRDTQHTELMRQQIIDLECYLFHLTTDNVDLNYWSDNTLHYLGVNVSADADDSLVVTALDAIHLISEDKMLVSDLYCALNAKLTNFSLHLKREDKSRSPTVHESSSDLLEIEKEEEEEEEEEEAENNVDIILKVEEITTEDGVNTSGELPVAERSGGSSSFHLDLDDSSSSYLQEFNDSGKENNTSSNCTGNSLSANSGWSSTGPAVHDESYDAILESYSSRNAANAAVLSSTPDINDVRLSITSGNPSSSSSIPNPLANATNLLLFGSSGDHGPNVSASSFSSDNDFEIIPKSVVLNNSDADNQRFFEQLSRLAQEHGLDEQDYKCQLCFRPIGMIYGKSRLCHVDGHLYCTECHAEEEAIIPAQIIYNWSFRRLAVSRHNKKRLATIETEPIFDIKLLSPLLYSVVPEMAEVLDLRTQLFFLHAYLFTCQEGVALRMRKMVWPREHLFEHIHLYSLADLLQVASHALAPTLRQTIAFARQHVASCALCKLKGYYCELCSGSQILYPFDTDSTRRCEACKSVFHARCFEESYDRNACPKCLRLAKKQKSQQSSII